MHHLLCVFAHPDDETFGPGGALAVWAQQGVKIDILCLTCGDAGGNPQVREQELRHSANILGIHTVTCLHYPDGRLGNADLQALEQEISQHILATQPDTLLTFDLNGVTGHLDHMAVASATTQAFRKTKLAQKLLYYTVSKNFSDNFSDYFVFFPPGKNREQVDEIVDISSVWELTKQAMRAHVSQSHDAEKFLACLEDQPKECWFLSQTAS